MSFQQHSWHQWMSIWHGLFYLLLIFITAAALTDSDVTFTSQAVAGLLGLLLLLCGWYAVSMVYDRSYWETHLARAAVYFAAGWSIWLMLTIIHPIFMFLLGVFYAQAAILLPTWSAVEGMIALTGVLLLRQLIEWREVNLWTLMTLIAATSGIVMKLSIDAVIHQSLERQSLIDQLHKAQASLAAAERQAGILHERQRLAHEIHDSLAQCLTSIIMHLETAETVLPPHTAVTRHLVPARTMARQGLAESRSMIWALQPNSQTRVSLSAVLGHFLEQWSASHHLPAVLNITGTPCPLPSDLEVTLLRATQEAVNNAFKHAQAKQIVVTLSYMEDMVALDVQDDGVGFEVVEAAPRFDGGFGLTGLRTRAEQFGGTLSIESTIGAGTTLALMIPLDGET